MFEGAHRVFVFISHIMMIHIWQGLHADGINGLCYLAHNKTVVTSSRDPAASIIIMHIADKLDSYIFKLAWGVRCFDLRQEVGVLATGSNDMMVRLWNPVVTSRPTSVLGGHRVNNKNQMWCI